MNNFPFKKTFIIISSFIAFILLLIAIYLLIIAPSFVGKIGSEGEMLKSYIEPAELQKLIEEGNEDIWIIDVRPEKAYKKGHIPSAKSFPSSSIEERLAELPQDKYLIIYCETGGRVEVVIKKLEAHGYTRYMNWGGNSRWPYELEVNN